MSELFHECGVAAVFHLGGCPPSPLISGDDLNLASRLIPRMLLDMQNRGQLSAGVTSYRENRGQLIDTYKEIGSVQEVFRMSHPAKCESLMNEYAGPVAIGHVRYATCGKDDRSYAQPFERHHIDKGKWFSFGFNGQLANYQQLETGTAGIDRSPPGPRIRYRTDHAHDQPAFVPASVPGVAGP